MTPVLAPPGTRRPESDPGRGRHRAIRTRPCPTVAGGRPALFGAASHLSLPSPDRVHRSHRARPTRAQCAVDQRPTARAAVVRRRRVVLGTLVAAMLAALALPWSGTGGHTLATPGSALAGAPLTHHMRYVVNPGDTPWSIARRLDPSADPRPVAAELVAEARSDVLTPGERLVLP